MPTFYIIRHAHKEKGDFYNPRLRHQDEPISQQGQEQARKLWSYLCDQKISAIYISGYRRTGQTIEYVAKQLGITPVIDERLNEIDNRLLDNLSEQEVMEMYPDFLESLSGANGRFPLSGRRNRRGSLSSSCGIPGRETTGTWV